MLLGFVLFVVVLECVLCGVVWSVGSGCMCVLVGDFLVGDCGYFVVSGGV